MTNPPKATNNSELDDLLSDILGDELPLLDDELVDVEIRRMNERTAKARIDAKAAIQKWAAQEVNRARIDEVEKLRKEQLDFQKAQSGHIRNNNRWPHTKGAGEAAKNVVACLDRRNSSINKGRASMMYKIVSRPNSHDTSITTEDFETVKKAIEFAMSMMWGDDFLIVTVVNWEAYGVDS